MKINFSKIILVLLVLGVIKGCEKATKPEVDEEYVRQIQQWQKQRLEKLKSPDGWLSLSGLYWLETGEKTFGRNSENYFIIDKKGVSPRIGVFILENETVRFKTSAGVKVLHRGQPITEINLEDDSCGNPTLLEWGSLSWYIINQTPDYANSHGSGDG
jgi:uncharacterized protein (DUF1684 family)